HVHRQRAVLPRELLPQVQDHAPRPNAERRDPLLTVESAAHAGVTNAAPVGATEDAGEPSSLSALEDAPIGIGGANGKPVARAVERRQGGGAGALPDTLKPLY